MVTYSIGTGGVIGQVVRVTGKTKYLRHSVGRTLSIQGGIVPNQTGRQGEFISQRLRSGETEQLWKCRVLVLPVDQRSWGSKSLVPSGGTNPRIPYVRALILPLGQRPWSLWPSGKTNV